MKKISLLMIVFTIALLSCKKDININNTFKNVSIDSKLSKTATTISGVFLDDGVLHFESNEAVENAYLELERVQNADIDAYYAKYNKYSDENIQLMNEKELDELNDYFNKIDIEIGFSEQNILKQFEKTLNFKSLRLINETVFTKWLKNDGDNHENDPTKDEFILDEFAQVMFNEHREIMIGEKIYIMIKNGFLEITDGNKETMLVLRNNTDDYINHNNIIAHVNDTDSENSLKSTNSSNCYAFLKNNRIKYNGSNKYYKGWVSRWLYPWGYRHAKAELTNYKKGFFGWSTYRAYSHVQVKGNCVVYNSNCSGHQSVDKENIGTRVHISVSQPNVNKAFKRYSYLNGGLAGRFRGAGLSGYTTKNLYYGW